MGYESLLVLYIMLDFIINSETGRKLCPIPLIKKKFERKVCNKILQAGSHLTETKPTLPKWSLSTS
jgi:hypothetical protein